MELIEGKYIRSFSYAAYNRVLYAKFTEVVIKKLCKFVLFGNEQKRRFFWERLACIPQRLYRGARPWLWVHANSIGEVNAVQPLLKRIRSGYPGIRILITTTNFSADARAHELRAGDAVLFFPYDIPFIIKKFLRFFQPVACVIVECDIWPNFVRVCRKSGVSVIVISGIMSRSIYRSLDLRYLYDHIFRLTADVLKNVDAYCMQSEGDAGLLRDVIPDHRGIRITGNLKFDLNPGVRSRDIERYRPLLGISPDMKVIVAGNIHKEEAGAVFEAFGVVRGKIPATVLVVAPRFLSETGLIETALERMGLPYTKRSGPDAARSAGRPVIILDSMGELPAVYGIADVAFVGGSMAYLEKFGGHNILEAAAAGVPVVFGPHMHNFQEIAELFTNNQAAVQVRNKDELADCLLRLLGGNGLEKAGLTESAGRLLREQREVGIKTYGCLENILSARNSNEN